MALKHSESENGKRTNDQKNVTVPYYKLYKFATPLEKFLILTGILGAMICGALQPYLLMIFGEVAGVVLDYTTAIGNNLTAEEERVATEKLFEGSKKFAISTGVGALVNIVCTYVSVVFLTRSSLRQTSKMRKLFLEKTLNQDIGWYDQHQTGDFATVITEFYIRFAAAKHCVIHCNVSIVSFYAHNPAST